MKPWLEEFVRHSARVVVLAELLRLAGAVIAALLAVEVACAPGLRAEVRRILLGL